MLVGATIRSRARSLLNELTEGFYLDTEFDNWISDAAIDISGKTYCYTINYLIQLVTMTEIYTLPLDTLKIISLSFDGVSLDRVTVSMKGKQTAIPTGKPKYFYEITDKVGVVPVPTSAEAVESLDAYIAIITDDITNIPLKFQFSAVLFVVVMGLIKVKQYDKAAQLYNMYMASLGFDRQDILTPQIEQPPPQNQYVLKVALQPQG
jgi:hypothetical protein